MADIKKVAKELIEQSTEDAKFLCEKLKSQYDIRIPETKEERRERKEQYKFRQRYHNR